MSALSDSIPELNIPPKVWAWIAEQARSGIDSQAVHQALLDAGWPHEKVSQIIRTVVSTEFPGYVFNPNISATYSTVIPEPILADGSHVIRVEGREMEVLVALIHPRVIVVDGFMDKAECLELIELARPRMERSTVIQPVSGMGVTDNVRTSTGMFFQLAENPLVAKIEKRIAQLLHWPVENGEGIQVLNYQLQQEYKPHQDFFDPADQGTPRSLGFAGQRVATLLMYLNTPAKGGGTFFPEAGGLEIHAKEGRAVFFSYASPTPLAKTMHGGMPVIEGEKWAATKWLRRKSLKTAGVPEFSEKPKK